MSDGSFELQAAIFTALNVADVKALATGGVFAPAPQDTPLPYVEIGESNTVSADVQCYSGLEESINIHVWTVPGSLAPAKKIISEIRDVLHAKKLTVSGRSSAFAVVSSSRVFPDADEQSIHGVVTLSVLHYGPEEG